jgi:hypothetical protein
MSISLVTYQYLSPMSLIDTIGAQVNIADQDTHQVNPISFHEIVSLLLNLVKCMLHW